MPNHKARAKAGQTIRYLVFKERRHWCAVALELNIVETGLDPREVLFSLFEAIHGSLISAAKTGNREVLRQPTDPEYEKMWPDGRGVLRACGFTLSSSTQQQA